MPLFDTVSVAFPDPNIFLCIPASAAVNPKGINTLLANAVITFLSMVIVFLIKGQLIYLEILLTVSFLITEFLKI